MCGQLRGRQVTESGDQRARGVRSELGWEIQRETEQYFNESSCCLIETKPVPA